MRLLIQPGEGIRPLIKAISQAKSCVEILIFRFDEREVERALASAVSRGVAVHALIAAKNRAGVESLRALEQRLLAAGVTVGRTGDDLVRYHGKMMIVDRKELHLMSFNLTHLDIERSRSFALITRSRDLVRDAGKLFECDSKRLPYEPTSSKLVVSPINARKELGRFIQGAKKELVIYDPQVSDRSMVRLLHDRAKAGVDIRIIGTLAGNVPGLRVHKLANLRLHTRTMVRDGQFAFIGSQSLREMELDSRREIGLIFREPKAVSSLLQTFEDDWKAAEKTKYDATDETDPGERIAKRVAKAVAREIPSVAPLLTEAVEEVVGAVPEIDLIPEEMEAVVKGAVKEAVKEAVQNVVAEVVERGAGRAG